MKYNSVSLNDPGRHSNLVNLNQSWVLTIRLMALIAGMALSTCNFFFLSLKNEITKKQGAGVEPRPLAPQAGMITTTLPAS